MSNKQLTLTETLSADRVLTAAEFSTPPSWTQIHSGISNSHHDLRNPGRILPMSPLAGDRTLSVCQYQAAASEHS